MALWVTNSSSAASLKLRNRAAASKVRNPFNGGNWPQTAVAANINQSKLDDAMIMIQNSISQINDGINSITEDD